MGQFSMEISFVAGSVLSGNQHMVTGVKKMQTFAPTSIISLQ